MGRRAGIVALSGALALASCAAQPPQDAATGPAFLANETVAVTRACIAAGFAPAAVAAALQAQGYARPVGISPMLVKADPAARALAATRIAVPVQGPCEVVVQTDDVRLVRGAMRNALRAEGFARDRSFDTEVWARGTLRLDLVRQARPTPRYQPNSAALQLKPLT